MPPGDRATARADGVAARIMRADPAFKPIVAAAGPVNLRPASGDPFHALLRAIAFQQLAGRAAAAILGRVLALFEDGGLSPAAVLAMSHEKLRSTGLSAAKQAAILDLAAKFADGTIPTHDFDELSDDEIIARLVQVRGVGRWTAEMFLIFELRRPDVWPVDDFAVRAGWKRLHRLDEAPTPKQLQPLGDAFRPHRSAAAWYCWRATDTVLPE
jgi:DNA-3-methyladenine glycosylase II